jgi:hypothetical protein
MGRGLSELQKTILRRALSNLDRDGRDLGADIFGCEVAADYWGWPLPGSRQPGSEWVGSEPVSPEEFYGRRPYRDCFTDEEKTRPNRWNHRTCWRPNGVTKEEANRVHAAISRAFLRLQERGLAEAKTGRTRWSGLILTPQGIETARQLSVNHPSSYHSLNR